MKVISEDTLDIIHIEIEKLKSTISEKDEKIERLKGIKENYEHYLKIAQRKLDHREEAYEKLAMSIIDIIAAIPTYKKEDYPELPTIWDKLREMTTDISVAAIDITKNSDDSYDCFITWNPDWCCTNKGYTAPTMEEAIVLTYNYYLHERPEE